MRCLDDGTLHDFYLLDAHMHLGIDRGPPIRNYDYGNFFKFCQSVEKTFFRELSRPSSDLKYRLEGFHTPEELIGFPFPLAVGEPPSMLFDEFFVSPYVSKIASVGVDSLRVDSDNAEASRNNNLILKWSSSPSFTRFNTFKYVVPSKDSSLENEIGTALSIEGFFGVKIKFDVLEGSLINVLKVMQDRNSPIIIEVVTPEKLETFWRSLDDAISKIGELSTSIILNSFGYDSNTDLLWKVLNIENVYADLSALDFNHLLEFIASAKERVSNWSKKLLFGTNYPFCKIGDIVKILKYFFSSDFIGDSKDLKRILGGNAVGLVPPHHNLVTPIGESCTLAIDKYSKHAAKMFEDLLRYFMKRGLVTINSCDFLVRGDEGVIDLSKYFLALRSNREPNKGVNFLFMKTPENVPRDALAIAVLNPKTLYTIRNRTIESFSANKNIKNLLSQASLISVEDEVNKVSKMIIDALLKTKTVDSDEVSVFSLSASPIGEKVVAMNPKDMVILDVKNDDILLIEPISTENWYAASVRCSEEVSPGELQVNEEIMSNWYVFEGDKARIEKYTGKTEVLEKVGFAVESSEKVELSSFLEKIKGKMDSLYEKLDGVYVGKGMKFILPELFLDFPFTIRPVHFQPTLEDKRLGIIKTGKTIIDFVSEQWIKPYNLILVINTSETSKNSDILIEEFEKIANLFHVLDTRQVEKFEKKVKEGRVTKNIAAILIGVSCLKTLSEKSNLCKASVISYSEQGNLFTLLEKGKVTPYIDFKSGRKDFSIKVLSSHILDKCLYPEGKANLREAGTKLREFLEKVGDQIPALTVIITPGEKIGDLEIFQEIADKDTRIKLVVIQIGKIENENELKRIINSIKGKYISIEKIDPKTLGMELVSQLTELL
ncbi:MAG: amidohydrolase family protein [Candidatus Jordarchaeaceae archaeon]